jgi:NAD(P)-dependent dehydrogenase (short-subunit alcohol dehydrogenase family)
MNFKNRVALVTGAAVGIGRATAIRLAEGGAKLILLDIDFAKLAAVKEELAAYTSEVVIYECDISDEMRVSEVIKQSISCFGKIDILVNNAAVWRTYCDFIDSTTELWEKYLKVNVMGTVHVTRSVLPSMLEHGYGRIINVASVAGVYGNEKMAHYSASKGAVISFTKALAKEIVDKGVLINAVSPGSVSPAENDDINFSKYSDLCYIGRTGTDRENADLICFLASEENGYISGENIVIDGTRKKL